MVWMKSAGEMSDEMMTKKSSMMTFRRGSFNDVSLK